MRMRVGIWRRVGFWRRVGIRNFRVRRHGERVYRDRFRIECIVVSIRVVVGAWIHIDIRKSWSRTILVRRTVIIACRVEYR